MYNVTIRCVHATSFAVETKSIIYSDSLSNPECNGDAPYCHLGPVRFCDIFPHYFPNGTIFEEQLFNVNIFRFFSTNFSEIYLILFHGNKGNKGYENRSQ